MILDPSKSNIRGGFRLYKHNGNQHEACPAFMIYWSNSPLRLALAVRPSTLPTHQQEGRIKIHGNGRFSRKNQREAC